MKLYNSVLFVVSLLILFSTSLLAETVSKKEKQLTQLQNKIRRVTDRVNDLETKKNVLIANLKQLDLQYGKSAGILKKLESQILDAQAFLHKNQQSIRDKKKDISRQKNTLANQMKAAHGMGRNEKLKLLLNQQDPALSGRMMVYYDYLNKVRVERISAIDADLQILKALETERLKEREELDKRLQEKQQERSVFLQTRAAQKKLLVKLDKQFLSENQRLHNYKVSERQLKQIIQTLQNSMEGFPLEEGVVKEFSKLKGMLPWPVKGRLAKRFGSRRAESTWDGVLIKAREGVEIKAVTRGRVVYADWLRGYGLLTIIDHGKGFMTLYAFNQSLYKTVGEWVEAGTVIASVGQSGGQLDTGLYFGIRQKGKPVNPVKWCRKIRHGTVM